MIRINRKHWLVLVVLFVVCLLNYCYNDLQMIVRHSLNIWYQLENGSLLHFYETGYQLPIGDLNQLAGEVPYDFGLYVPFAIWNFPLFVWEKITGMTFESNYLALLWARIGLMIPFAGSNWALWRIGDFLGKDEAEKSGLCFLFSSSMFLLNGLFCLGQIDIINTFFMLMGILAYMRRDKKRFIAWFMIAITCKVFAIMIFLPLLILWEKRILYIIVNTLQALTITLVTKVIFFRDKLQTPTTFDERRFSQFLFDRQIEFGKGSISVFVLFFCVLLIWCWNQQYDKDKWVYYTIWTAFAGYVCFFCGAKTYPYWSVVLSPFIPLLILLYPEKGKILLWLEMIAAALYFLKGVCDFGWIYTAETNMRWMLAGIINNREIRGIDFRQYFSELDAYKQGVIQSILLSGLWAATGGILTLTYPAKERKMEVLMKLDSGSIWFRLLMNAVLTLMPLLCYVFFE